MFEVDNEFKNANVPRTIRFTETLFDELNKISYINFGEKDGKDKIFHVTKPNNKK